LGGYREAFVVGEDYDLLLRVVEKTDVEVLDEVLYRYRKVPGSLTGMYAGGSHAAHVLAREFMLQRAERGADDYDQCVASGRLPPERGKNLPVTSDAAYQYRLFLCALRCREYRIMLKYLGRGLRRDPLWLPKYGLMVAVAKMKLIFDGCRRSISAFGIKKHNGK
jgi:hypothetical protein